MGSMDKAMIRACISSDKYPNEQKPREQLVSGIQKDEFTGTAKKKNRNDEIAQRSLVQFQQKEEDSDSHDDNQPEF